MSKEVKKVKVFFDESQHYQEMNKAYEIAAVFKAAKQELETIISITPITEAIITIGIAQIVSFNTPEKDVYVLEPVKFKPK